MPDDIGAVVRFNRTLIMGVGNLLLGDEGLGVHAIRALQSMKLPDDVELLDAGTAFIDALPHLANVRKLVIIDAIEKGRAPGTVYRIQEGHDSCANYCASIHGVSVIGMMKIVQNSLPDTVTVFGIEPGYIGWSMELSNAVKGSMAMLIEAVCGEIITYHNAGDIQGDVLPLVC